jgi:hypothetical protein
MLDIATISPERDIPSLTKSKSRKMGRPIWPPRESQSGPLFGPVSFLFLAKVSRFLSKFASILAQLLRVIEDLLLIGSKKRTDLFPRFVPHGLHFRPLFFPDRFDLRPAGVHDLPDFFFLLVSEIQESIQHLPVTPMITVPCPMTPMTVKPVTRCAKLIAATKFLRISRRRSSFGGRGFRRRGRRVGLGGAKVRNDESRGAYDACYREECRVFHR